MRLETQAARMHRFPAATLQVGQRTEDIGLRVSCFTFIPKRLRQQLDAELFHFEHLNCSLGHIRLELGRPAIMKKPDHFTFTN
jgi:hypothetical protein